MNAKGTEWKECIKIWNQLWIMISIYSSASFHSYDYIPWNANNIIHVHFIMNYEAKIYQTEISRAWELNFTNLIEILTHKTLGSRCDVGLVLDERHVGAAEDQGQAPDHQDHQQSVFCCEAGRQWVQDTHISKIIHVIVSLGLNSELLLNSQLCTDK